MPGRDGTGPLGQGPVGGGGAGMGRGGRGASGNMAAGSGGYCVCPKCGERVPHRRGTPCSSLACSKCGWKMVRGE